MAPVVSPFALEVIRRIDALFAIERDINGKPAEERLSVRQQLSRPLIDDLHAYMATERTKLSRGNDLAKAIDYMLKRWPAILRYVSRGDTPIDNNPVENAIRPITLGRRNWLFTGSERAGCRAAAIQSLLATAKLNGLEPYAWLKDVLEKLPVWPYSRIDELLPLRPTEVH